MIRGFITVLLLCVSLHGSDRYWVYFIDKGDREHLPFLQQEKEALQQVTPRAMERRQKRGLQKSYRELIREDLPLSQPYIRQLTQAGFTLHATSRWFNAVSGQASPQVLDNIARLPFVKAVERVKSWRFSREISTGKRSSLPGRRISKTTQYNYGPSASQIQFHNIHLLHEKGLTGENVIVAVFDTGFRLENNSLQHIRSRLVGEYDFVQMDSVTANQPGDVPGQDSHGTIVLSVLAGFLPDTLIGPAFGARFLLAKTEILDRELHVEEDHWAMAAEWAENLGADIVSTSVGYSTFDPGEGDYSYEDMDGQTTIITRAANQLASRGVLVVTSAGNEGNSSWRYITAPADGQYVLATGAVNESNEVCWFQFAGTHL